MLPISDKEVAYYATFITGHPEAMPDPQHLAAARAVLEGLAKDDRLVNPTAGQVDPADVEALAVMLCSFQVGLWRDGRHIQRGTPASWWRPQREEVKQFYREQARYALTSLRNRS
jgi:hypothetical protein